MRCPPRISSLALYSGAMSRETKDLLAISLDADPVIEAYKKDVDRTLLRENLKLTTNQRVEKMIAALRFADAVRHSRLKDRAK